ncbi:MAG: tryptophan--tRNA ligase [Candidatus Omnitrophota bacterium]
MLKKRILSGMRPTGQLHLGHLVGTLENWIKLQEEYDCYFMVADWHALMGEYENPRAMPENAIDNVIDWISYGIDPDKSTLFIQSEVSAHLDLFMIFSCFTPLGWLERCPTYKEQLREVNSRDLHTYGFLGYPVLQAADILVYKADKVPVGEDQLPHLELTREIARRFNSLYNTQVLPEPEAILTRASRLIGTDGRKMSKSYNNAINLSDTQESIQKKIAGMITDPQRIKLTDKGHPDICNVNAYYGFFAPEMKAEVDDWCSGAKLGCIVCKKKLAEKLIESFAPYHQKRNELAKDPDKIRDILRDGKIKANAVANETLKEIKAAMGI